MRQLLRFFMMIGALLFWCGAAKYNSATKTGVTPYVKSISISGSSSVGVKSSKTFTCYAIYSNGKKVKISPKWTSSKSTVASVSSSGKVTGKKSGTVTIKATATFTKNNGKKGKTKYTLKASKSVKVVKSLKYLSISGASTLGYGKSTTFKCYAVYTDGSKKAITPSWSKIEYYYWGGTLCSLSSKGVLKYKKIAINSKVKVVLKAKYSGKTCSKTVTLVTGGSGGSSGTKGYYISGPTKLAYGRTANYYLYYNGKKVTSASVAWSRSGLCTMSDKGSYGMLRASNRPVGSTNKVTVRFKYKGFSGSKSVTITR